MTHAAHTYEHYLSEKGLKSWLFTLDHKRIGLMYFFTTLFFFIVGGIFALLVRFELLLSLIHI